MPRKPNVKQWLETKYGGRWQYVARGLWKDDKGGAAYDVGGDVPRAAIRIKVVVAGRGEATHLLEAVR
jgi:hypothetical protein